MVVGEVGNYCKAYLLSDLRKFPGWKEQAGNARSDSTAEAESGMPRQLDDDSVVFVQESFVVTDGIFLNENILFDAVDAEWVAFCVDDLGFSIPDDVAQATREQTEHSAA